MLIFASDKFVYETFGENPSTYQYLDPSLQIPKEELDSKIHGIYIVTNTKVWTVKDCKNEKNKEFQTFYDLMEHCDYGYSKCYCENNLPVADERCGDVNACVLNPNMTKSGIVSHVQ